MRVYKITRVRPDSIFQSPLTWYFAADSPEAACVAEQIVFFKKYPLSSYRVESVEFVCELESRT